MYFSYHTLHENVYFYKCIKYLDVKVMTDLLTSLHTIFYLQKVILFCYEKVLFFIFLEFLIVYSDICKNIKSILHDKNYIMSITH